MTALCCHQTLAASRPTAARSTEFYLWIAFGGALGGLFNVFLAPLLFRSVVEYPLGLVAAALLRPGACAPLGWRRRARANDDATWRCRRDWPRSWRAASGLLGRASARLGPTGRERGARRSAGRGRVRGLLLSRAAPSIRPGAGGDDGLAARFYTQGAAQIVLAARSFYAVHKVVRVGPRC